MELIKFDNLGKVLEEYAVKVRNLYQDNLISHDRIASGDLLNSVEYVVQGNGQAWEVKLHLADYWKYVEEDTSPHWPPVDKILEWIRVKPVIPRPDKDGKIPTREQLAYLIGRKISRVGTEGSHDLQDALDAVNAEYRDKFAYALHEDARSFLKIVLGEIQGSIQRDTT